MSECVRCAFFETRGLEDIPEFPKYTSLGGTVFLLNRNNEVFGVTCGHIKQGYEWTDLIIADQKFGQKVAGISTIYKPAEPAGWAVESDILDIRVIRFTDDISASFFRDTAYITDAATTGNPADGDDLVVCGSIRDLSEFTTEDISPVYCQLDFRCDGSGSSNDVTLRTAYARYKDPTFDSLVGLSGSPVFNKSANRLCGMVTRAGMRDGAARIHFIEIEDVIQFITAIQNGSFRTTYTKNRYLKLQA